MKRLIILVILGFSILVIAPFFSYKEKQSYGMFECKYVPHEIERKENDCKWKY